MTASDTPEEGQPKGRTLIIAAAAIGAAILACICILVIVVALDPFGLDLLGRLRGGGDPLAEAMPSGTSVYLQVDALRLLSEDTRSITDALIGAADEDVRDLEDAIDEIDNALDDETGLTFTDDIQPWIGQYAAFGLVDLDFNDFDEVDSTQLIIAIEVRDRDLADAFIEDLLDSIDSSGPDFIDDDYGDAVIYEDEFEEIAFSRSRNVFYVATNSNIIKDAIDSQTDESLADDPEYRSALDELPRSRAITAYVSGSIIDESSRFLEAEADLQGTCDTYGNALQSVAMSLSFLDNGIELDLVAVYDEDELPEEVVTVLADTRDVNGFASYFPEDTFALYSGSRLDLAWESARECIIDTVGREEFNFAMDDFEDEFGFNPDDLFPVLDGEYALGVYETNSGYFADSLDVSIGSAFIVQTSDAAEIESRAEDIADAINDQSFFLSVDSTSSGDGTFYEVTDDDFGELLFSFGTNGNFVLIGTDTSELGDALDQSNSLADSPIYNEVWQTFSGRISPTLYLDILTLINFLEDSGADTGDLRFFEPLNALAIGNRSFQDGVAHTTSILFVETN